MALNTEKQRIIELIERIQQYCGPASQGPVRLTIAADGYSCGEWTWQLAGTDELTMYPYTGSVDIFTDTDPEEASKALLQQIYDASYYEQSINVSI